MIFDWEKAGPCREALEAFARVTDEAEFPNTYSGRSWLAAYRIWKSCKDNPASLDIDPYDYLKAVDVSGLGLSGFMWGWAVNAVRQMLNMEPIGNCAVVTIGEGNVPLASEGAAEDQFREIIGAPPRRFE